MAARSASLGKLWSLFPRLALDIPAVLLPRPVNLSPRSTVRIPLPALPNFSLELPFPSQPITPRITIRLPSPSEIWRGIVLAVPKKKVSLRRRRIRQNSPSRQIKPVENLQECPGCGRVKRSHTVCSPCHDEIKQLWRAENGTLDKEEPSIPDSIDPEFLKLGNRKYSEIATPKVHLHQLNKKENSKRRQPMFDYKELRK
ncbi:hypothetical protein V1514DRAFT_332129 [Lipomyces japonicus]|uniref:mitochondrial 54S ribosomal protein bL32m n=1 Tax=Lipomyces japonicus TaxID=56871 RepID=UPI0034CD0F35